MENKKFILLQNKLARAFCKAANNRGLDTHSANLKYQEHSFGKENVLQTTLSLKSRTISSVGLLDKSEKKLLFTEAIINGYSNKPSDTLSIQLKLNDDMAETCYHIDLPDIFEKAGQEGYLEQLAKTIIDILETQSEISLSEGMKDRGTRSKVSNGQKYAHPYVQKHVAKLHPDLKLEEPA